MDDRYRCATAAERAAGLPRALPKNTQSEVWQLVAGRKRCQHCSHMVEPTWCWFTRPGTWTRCYCEPCVEYLLDEGERS